jgi:predicted 3-demethylubiquinone-9 3-methyltransferase (glyoxalase superfamily)
MPLDDHGFSRRFGWLNDRFGLSWQLSLGLRTLESER